MSMLKLNSIVKRSFSTKFFSLEYLEVKPPKPIRSRLQDEDADELDRLRASHYLPVFRFLLLENFVPLLQNVFCFEVRNVRTIPLKFVVKVEQNSCSWAKLWENWLELKKKVFLLYSPTQFEGITWLFRICRWVAFWIVSKMFSSQLLMKWGRTPISQRSSARTWAHWGEFSKN